MRRSRFQNREQQDVEMAFEGFSIHATVCYASCGKVSRRAAPVSGSIGMRSALHGGLMLTVLCACSPGNGRYARVGDIGIRPFEYVLRDVRLPSGLRLLVEEDHRAPLVGLLVVVGGGASDDPAGRGGLANPAARLTLRARPDASGPARREP